MILKSHNKNRSLWALGGYCQVQVYVGLEGVLEVELEWDMEGDSKGDLLSSSGQVWSRSGSGYSSNLILLSLTEVGRLVDILMSDKGSLQKIKPLFW